MKRHHQGYEQPKDQFLEIYEQTHAQKEDIDDSMLEEMVRVFTELQEN